MKKRSLLMSIALLMISATALADTIQCTNKQITEVTVEANRDDGFDLSDKVVIKMTGTCAGVSVGYIDNSHPASLHFLQAALAAKTTGATVAVALNTDFPVRNNNNNQLIAYQLAYLSIQ